MKGDTETEPRIVTAQDIADAATIANIIGGMDECHAADASFGRFAEDALLCISTLHSQTCEHCEHHEPCSHADFWECVAAALDATPAALALYMRLTCLLDASQRASEMGELDRDEVAWLSELGAFAGDEFFHSELEAAGLLAEQILPPGWVLR